MKLIGISSDAHFLHLITDEGTRKLSLVWTDAAQIEKRCRLLIGQEIELTAMGGWDPRIWFHDIRPVQQAQDEPSARRWPAPRFCA